MDNSIKLVSSDGAKTLEMAHGHCAPVTCLGLSPDSSYLATGSRDTTVLLWRIHREFSSRSSSLSDPRAGTSTTNSASSSNLSSTLADKSRRCRIEGPIHVLRGHQSEVHCCYVSSDLGIVVSCSHSSDVLLHSIRRGRLLRKLPGIRANAVCLSSEGVLLTWDKLQHSLRTFTLNGVMIASIQLPFSGSISCMEVSVNGQSALIGINTCSENDGPGSWDLKLKKPGSDNINQGSDKDEETNRLDLPSPSICFLDLHKLKVWGNDKISQPRMCNDAASCMPALGRVRSRISLVTVPKHALKIKIVQANDKLFATFC